VVTLHGVVSIGAAAEAFGFRNPETTAHSANFATPLPRRVLTCHFRYHHRRRTHLSLKGSPGPRRIQLDSAGEIVLSRRSGCLHCRYERRPARATTDWAIASRDSSFSTRRTGNAHPLKGSVVRSKSWLSIVTGGRIPEVGRVFEQGYRVAPLGVVQ
jgi:hypothetical protein